MVRPTTTKPQPIRNLTDVAMPVAPTHGQYMGWDAGLSRWRPFAAPAPGAQAENVAFDDFDRPASPSLGTSDSGHLWLDDLNAWDIFDDGLPERGIGLCDSRLSGTQSGAGAQALATVQMGTANHSVTVRGGNGDQWGVCVRRSSPNTCILLRRQTIDQKWNLYKLVNGVLTQIPPFFGLPSHPYSQTATLEVIGDTITVTIETMTASYAVPSDVPSATRAGLVGKSGGGVSIAAIYSVRIEGY